MGTTQGPCVLDVKAAACRKKGALPQIFHREIHCGEKRYTQILCRGELEKGTPYGVPFRHFRAKSRVESVMGSAQAWTFKLWSIRINSGLL